jgi:hypothetical protein
LFWYLPELIAQTPPQTDVSELKIVPVNGEDAINIIKKKTAVKPVVEVRDQNNLPVAGASVTFLLPTSGPSGSFANGGKVLTVTTDQNGRAAVTALRANDVAGPYRINVTASSPGKTSATITVAQSNVLGTPTLIGGVSATALGVGAGVGAAVITTVVVVTKVVGGGKTAKISVGPPSLP